MTTDEFTCPFKVGDQVKNKIGSTFKIKSIYHGLMQFEGYEYFYALPDNYILAEPKFKKGDTVSYKNGIYIINEIINNQVIISHQLIVSLDDIKKVTPNV